MEQSECKEVLLVDRIKDLFYNNLQPSQIAM